MKSLYPTSFVGLRRWADENNVSTVEARVRFAQYAILRAIAMSRELSAFLVLKGGNALDFVWCPNRSTRDLDFSVDMLACPRLLDTRYLRSRLQPGLDAVGRTLGIAFRIQHVEQRPPGPGKTFVTFELRIGYALSDEARLRALIQQGRPVPNVVPLQISINEPICGDALMDLGGVNPMRVSSLEDIVAEKLRALLQQSLRDRTRRQYLLDIAVILREQIDLDRGLVSSFLLRKAAERDVPVSRAAFSDPDLEKRARQDYDALRQTTRTIFVPFEEALACVREFVGDLAIPEKSDGPTRESDHQST